MSSADSFAEQIQRLRSEFRVYDRNVDVVSAWELIFTQSDTAMPARVRHFERFPSIPVEGGRELTPDFTVVFNEGRGLVAEIANFGQDELSVDNLCQQILGYDALTHLPVGEGAFAAVSETDVMLLVPLELGTAAVRRIINARLVAQAHPYKPQVPPVIVQFTFAQDSEKYVFQRRPDSGNGNFRDEGVDEKARLSAGWFDSGDVSMRPVRFREIKAARAFMNDSVTPLYLTTFLWAKTFATRAATVDESRPVEIGVVPRELAEQVRAEHGVVRAGDIERAMTFLEGARLARRSPSGWVVYWRELHQSGEDRDLADVLAKRFVRPPSRPGWQVREPEQPSAIAPVQERLFET